MRQLNICAALAVGCFLLVVSGSAFAADTSSPTRSRLSQIAFDSPDGPIVDPEEMLKEGKVQMPPPQAAAAGQPIPSQANAIVEAPAPVAPAKAAAARASLKTSLIEPSTGDGAAFIAPRLKGPVADSINANQITTNFAWPAPQKGSCGDASSEEQVCGKAKALRELLFRYTGSDDYFQTQCSERCLESGRTSVLTGLSILPVQTMDFEMLKSAKQCRYQIRRAGGWVALKARRVTCSCLPNSCLEGPEFTQVFNTVK